MTMEWLRTRLLPWGMWAVTMATAAWLWRDVRHESAVGFALGVEYKLSPALAARVDAVPVAPGQRVRAGQVVATLDARNIDAELAIVAAERTRLEAELGAIRSETSVRVGESSRELEESVASADLALKSARAERSVRAAEFKALEAQTQRLSELVEQHMADRRELDALRVTHASLQTQLQMADTLVAQLVSQVAGARARRALLPTDATELALGPVHAELAVLAARELLLAAQKDATILRAPADGEVAAVLIHPGEVATVGLPVLTIVGPGPGDEVIVCLSETQAGTVRVGEAAIVTPRGAVGDGLASHVTRVAPQVSELPLRCRRNPQYPEWGREVAVALDTHLPLLPGQAFSVSFLGHPSPHANTDADAVPVAPASAPPPAPTPTPQLAAPRPPELPPALAAHTRFEPSAIAWLPARDRFVIASDDTGLDKTHEHAPWLFTMDTRGRVDPEPLIVAGVPGFGDLEAVAVDPDGSLYVLASQSRSRKGKRPDSRQLFARVAIDADGARVLASTSLAAQLDAAGAKFLATLGLHDTAELDLEGMTTTAAGGLLLGLKQPLDAAGRAPIWHLAKPELLLAGDLANAGLTAWGAVSLAVQADGAPRPAGISDLLELPDGTLVIAGTASGADPTTQDGTIWIAHGHDGLAAPRALRSFPGLKPEGIALRPDGAALVVVFDTGAAPGLWMELPWPTP